MFKKINIKIPVYLLVLVILLGAYLFWLNISQIPQENVDKFHSLTRDFPLFYDPATDVSFLQTSALALKKRDDEIISTDTSFRRNQNGKNNNVFSSSWRIWPDDFLLTLPEIHDATQLFLDKPTVNNGQKLLTLYEKATKEYKIAINLNIEALEKILSLSPNIRTKQILFLGSATNPEIVLSDFRLILKNAKELEKEVENRGECLYKGHCIEREISKDQKNFIKVPFKSLDNDILGISEDQKIFGPYWASTGCFGFNKDGKEYSHPFYILEKESKNGKDLALNPILANTKHYRDYNRISDQRASQLWFKYGITLRPHSGLNDYLCTDLRYLPDLYLQYLDEHSGATSKISKESKLSSLPYLIQRTLSTSNSLIYELMYSKKAIDPLYLLINRSAYSLYFGTFSKNIWLIKENPSFLIREDFSNEAIRAGYVTYQDLVSEGVGREQIIKLNSLPKVDEIYKKELQLK